MKIETNGYVEKDEIISLLAHFPVCDRQLIDKIVINSVFDDDEFFRGIYENVWDDRCPSGQATCEEKNGNVIRVIRIAIKNVKRSKHSLLWVLGHELGHLVDAPQLYEKLCKEVNSE